MLYHSCVDNGGEPSNCKACEEDFYSDMFRIKENAASYPDQEYQEYIETIINSDDEDVPF